MKNVIIETEKKLTEILLKKIFVNSGGYKLPQEKNDQFCGKMLCDYTTPELANQLACCILYRNANKELFKTVDYTSELLDFVILKISKIKPDQSKHSFWGDGWNPYNRSGVVPTIEDMSDVLFRESNNLV